MRLQAEGPPDPVHRRGTHAARLRHRARAPLRGVPRHRLQRHRHHPFDVRVADLARGARPRLVQKAVASLPDEPPAPLADRLARRAQPGRHAHVALSLGRRQHDPRAHRKRLSGRGPPQPAFQLFPLSVADLRYRPRVVIRHGAAFSRRGSMKGYGRTVPWDYSLRKDF